MLILKTLLLAPVVFIIATILYMLIGLVYAVSYFVGTLMLPTALYSYLKKLAEYKRFKTNLKG